MNDNNPHTNRNEIAQSLSHGEMAQIHRPRQRKQGFLRRLTALILSAALFGTVSAGTFYGVNGLLTKGDSSTASISTASTGTTMPGRRGNQPTV